MSFRTTNHARAQKTTFRINWTELALTVTVSALAVSFVLTILNHLGA